MDKQTRKYSDMCRVSYKSNLKVVLAISLLAFLSVLLIVAFGCKSSNIFITEDKSIPRETKGPFFEEDLLKDALLVTSFERQTIKRIVYPPFSTNSHYRNILDNYLGSNQEIQAFYPIGEFSKNTQEDTEAVYKLGIYFFEEAHRNEILSVSIQAEYKSPEIPNFSTWYSYNYNLLTLTEITYDTLFEDKDAVLLLIASYLKEDIRRQKRLRQVAIEDDFFLNLDPSIIRSFMDSFVFYPSSTGKNFSGIKIFLNRIGTERDSTYSSNIPSYVFRTQLKNNVSELFIDEKLPLIVAPPNQVRAATYPDISPFYN